MENSKHRDVIIKVVRRAFVHSMTPLIEEKKLTKEMVNRYFQTIFESRDLVELLNKSMEPNSNTIFGTVTHVIDLEELIAYDEFETVLFHSRHDGFSVYIKETHEPRDSAIYIKILFKPE